MNKRPQNNASAPASRPPTPHRARIGSVLGRPLPGVPPAEAGCQGGELAHFAGAASPGAAESQGSHASAILRRVLPDIYFVNTPQARSQRHLELLERLSLARSPLLDFHEAPGRPLTECTLCAFDESAPGLLAKMCGTMAALDLSIHTAFIYTLRLETSAQDGSESAADGEARLSLAPASQAAAGRAVALNTFLMSQSYFGHDRALTEKTQRRLKAELCRVLSGQSGVAALLARSRRSLAPLQIHEMSVENREHEEQTRILLRAGDSFGVLYRAATALASLGLDIAAAQVSTREEAADDLFFVTRENAKLPDPELAGVQHQLRTLLQSEI